jgi:alpha-mannosidase
MPNENADMGTHRIRYGLLPHQGLLQAGDVPAWAETFNNRLTQVVTELVPESVIAVGGRHEASIVIDAVKRAEDGNMDYIVRLHENYGGLAVATLHLNPNKFGPISSCCVVNMLEEPDPEVTVTDLAVEANTVEIQLRAFQVLTLRLKP